MSKKRFRKLQGYMADTTRKFDNGDVYAMDFTEVEDMLNALHEENERLKKVNGQLQKDIEFKIEDLTYWKYKANKVLTELTKILSKYG